MAQYRVLITPDGVYVKKADFFESQGGLTDPWGRDWEPIEADSLIHARQLGIALRRSRFPNSHKQPEELGIRPETVWPEALGEHEAT